MERLRIEIRAVGPLQCAKGRIQFDGVENCQILQWCKHFAFQQRTKIDSLLTAVLKTERQSVRSDDVKVLDAMDSVTQAVSPIQRNGSILRGG